jgi:transcriptional regulator with XRE-family HTH domain
MNNEQLKEKIKAYGLQQSEFANMLDVTPRSVNMWVNGERAIPGPVEAYLRLFESSPSHIRENERLLARKGKVKMKNAFYGIQFLGTNEEELGAGTILLQEGRLFGVDFGKVKYDGNYNYDNASNLIHAKIKVTIPPGTNVVLPIGPQPVEIAFEVEVTFPKDALDYKTFVVTQLGEVKTCINHLRDIPTE